MSDTLGVLVVIAAIAWGAATAWDAWWGRKSLAWPTVPGTITESRLEQTPYDQNDPVTGAPQTREEAKIEYHFEVDNRVFWGGRIAYDGAFGRLAARGILDRYPRGATVSVAYDPTDPRRCVLEPGPRRTMTAALAGAVALLIVALVLILV